MRKHLGWYLKVMKKSARLRDEINKLESADEVVGRLEAYIAESLT